MKSMIKRSRTEEKHLFQRNNKFYKSEWYIKAKKEEEQKIPEDLKTQKMLTHLKEMKDKEKKYAEYIKQNFKPEIDPKLSEMIESNLKVSESRIPSSNVREKGLEYLSYCK